MHAPLDAGQRQFLMQMGGSRNGDRVDTAGEQRLDVAERPATQRPRNDVALLAIGVRNADKPDAGKIAEDPGMVAAHDANAYHTYA